MNLKPEYWLSQLDSGSLDSPFNDHVPVAGSWFLRVSKNEHYIGYQGWNWAPSANEAAAFLRYVFIFTCFSDLLCRADWDEQSDEPCLAEDLFERAIASGNHSSEDDIPLMRKIMGTLDQAINAKTEKAAGAKLKAACSAINKEWGNDGAGCFSVHVFTEAKAAGRDIYRRYADKNSSAEDIHINWPFKMSIKEWETLWKDPYLNNASVAKMAEILRADNSC